MSKITLKDLGLDLPEVQDPMVIMYEDGEYIAVSEDDPVASASTLLELYDTPGVGDTKNLTFHPDLPELTEDSVNTTYMILTPISEEGYGRVLSAMSDSERLETLKNDLDEFLEYEERLESEESFFNAYNFLKHHPMFWKKYKVFGDPVEGKSGRPTFYDSEPSWDWSTDEGMDEIDLIVYEDKVVLEAGPILRNEEGEDFLPSFTVGSFDPDLSASASTYEDAVIELSKNVRRLYHSTGLPKNG